MKNRNMFICQLPIDKQNAIREELESYYESIFKGDTEKDIEKIVEETMSERIWVLEENFPYLLDELNI